VNSDETFRLLALCAPAGTAAAVLGYSLTRLYLSSSPAPVLESGDTTVPGSRVFRLLLAPLAIWLRQREATSSFVRDNLRNYRRDLLAAGSFWGGLDEAEVLAARFILPVATLLATLVVGLLGNLPLNLALLAALLLAALAFMMPDSALRDAAARRRAWFLKQLPGGLDILKIAAESGLDFHASIDYLVQIYLPGPVRDELRLFQRDFQLGVPTVEALLNVSRRIGAPEAATVFTSLAQAVEMGTSISEMLAGTAAEMRRKRLLSAETEAQKAVVKITFPLLLLILPGIFIVLLAPIVKPMMDAFGSM